MSRMSTRPFSSPGKQVTPGMPPLNEISSTGDPLTTNTKSGKKFMNGWTKELQDLAAEWADHAACYEYLHEQCSQFLYQVNLCFKVPIIILSFLTGSTNIGLAGFFDNEESSQKKAQWIIAGIGIGVGMLGALDIFFKFGQESEAHHTARINWGNFHRNISFQLKLHPNERIDAVSFMKMMQNEMSRLIVQSPKILHSVIKSFNKKMKDSTVKKPSIVNGLEHISVFDDKEARLVHVVEEVVHLIQRKKNLLKDIVVEDLEKRLKTNTLKEVETLLLQIQTPKEAFFREELESLKQELQNIKSSGIEEDELKSPTISLVPSHKSNQKTDLTEEHGRLSVKPAELEFLKE